MELIKVMRNELQKQPARAEKLNKSHDEESEEKPLDYKHLFKVFV